MPNQPACRPPFSTFRSRAAIQRFTKDRVVPAWHLQSKERLRFDVIVRVPYD